MYKRFRASFREMLAAANFYTKSLCPPGSSLNHSKSGPAAMLLAASPAQGEPILAPTSVSHERSSHELLWPYHTVILSVGLFACAKDLGGSIRAYARKSRILTSRITVPAR
jgi:hypothetical protein